MLVQRASHDAKRFLKFLLFQSGCGSLIVRILYAPVARGMASASSTPSSSTKALLLHCGAIQLSNPRTKEQTHDVLRYLSGQSKAKPIKRRSTIFKLEPELLLNLNPKPKVEEITLQEHVTDAVINRRIVSFDKVACQGGISRLGSHPASTGQLIRVHPLLSDGCSRHTHSTSLPASLHAMGFKTSPPELATIRECEEYTIPYSRHPCDITASIYTLYKLKPGAALQHAHFPLACFSICISPLATGHVDSEIDINAKSPGLTP
jgi:hypothetical protein